MIEWIPYIAPPLIGALIGWGTNALAVRMIFRPREPRKLGPFIVQGLIPRRRTELAHTIGETVEQHLISHTDVMSALNAPAVSQKLRAVVDAKLASFMQERLGSLHPMLGMLVGGAMSDGIRVKLVDEVMGFLPGVVEQAAEALEESLDFKQIVVEKIEAFELERLEAIVLKIAAHELRAIEVLGGVLGFVIGVAQSLLLWALL
jgi:uncharacterized membrane protein YheB (UPF0754 family)